MKFFNLLFLLFTFQNCFAQEYPYRHYSVYDGLPQTQVWDIFQDSKDYMWICTKGGLARFDGIEFITYTTKDGLNDDFVYHISEGPDSALYITSQKGVNRYKNGIITSIYDSPDYMITNSFVRMISADSGYLSKNYKFYLLANGQLGNPMFDTLRMYDFYIDKNQNILFSNGSGVYVYRNNKIEVLLEGRNYKLIKSNFLYFIYDYEKRIISELRDYNIIPRFDCKRNSSEIITPTEFQDQTLIFNPYDVFRISSGKIKKVELPQWRSQVVYADRKNKLWFGTQKGLEYRVNTTFLNFENPYSEFDHIYNVWEDNEGKIWFGSFYNRLWMYDSETIFDMTALNNGYDGYIYSAQVKDFDGKTLIGTNNGLLKFSTRGLHPAYPEIRNYAMYATKDTSRNRLLMAMHPSGMHVIDSDGTVTKFDFNVIEQVGLLSSVLVDQFGDYWVSGKLGICKYSYEDGWINLKYTKTNFSKGAIAMTMDNRGNIWLGTMDGVYFHNYRSFRKVGEEYFNKQIGVLSMTDYNQLLVGTIDGIGLIDLDKFYNNGEESLRFFDQNDGFQGIECRHNATFKDSKGNHWICTSNNVVKFNPEHIDTDTLPPQLYFTEISALDNNVEWQIEVEFPSETSVIYETRQRDLRIGFHAINYNAPKSVLYSHFLEGQNQQWTNPSNERHASYTGLLPGEYILKVKACNGDGVWIDEPIEMSLSIIPYFWETNSFKLSLLGIVVLGGIIAASAYSKSKIKKLKADEQRKKELLKHQFLSVNNLINPHFTFNVINSISSSILDDNKYEANDYLIEFSYLLKSTLEYSDEISWPLKKEIDFLKEYLKLQKYRFEDLFDYEFQISTSVDTEIHIPKMIAQGYVENAIKHGLRPKGGEGKLIIKLEDEGSSTTMTIEDNGIGRPAANRNKNTAGTGKGISINSEMVNLYNELTKSQVIIEIEDLVDSNNIALGTRVYIQLH